MAPARGSRGASGSERLMFDFKYAEYIVPAFGITAFVIGGLVWTTLAHSRRWRKRFEELSARDGK